MLKFRASLIALSFAFTAPAFAQSVDIGELGEASDYDAAISKDADVLGAGLWKGTSARLAARLIEYAPLLSNNAAVSGLVKAAVFSGGVPPEGDAASVQAYRAARLTAATRLGQDDAVAAFIAGNEDLASDPGVMAGIKLAAGDTKEACHITDGVTEGRSEPNWARLRAFCHVIRGEVPAAELTTELLENSGYEDPLYYNLMDVLTGRKKTAKIKDMSDDPLYAAMAGAANIDWPDGMMPPALAANTALNKEAKPEARLAALYRAAPILSDAQIGEVFAALSAQDSAAGEVKSFDYDSAVKEKPAQGTAQLFALLQTASRNETKAKASAELLRRADGAGVFSRMADFLEPEILQFSAKDKAMAGPTIFARTAIDRGDIGALQSLHRALGGREAAQARIALAADSLGNGFAFGALGKDIESRLENPTTKTRAVRDTVIGLAMGAELSEAAAIALDGAGKGNGLAINPGTKQVLLARAKAGHRAETALRVAAIIGEARPSALDNPSLAAIITALRDVQLTDYAGQIAAEDFLSDTPK